VEGALLAGIPGVLVDTLGFYPEYAGARVSSVKELIDSWF
jgi:hypothetical protein